MDMTEKGNNNNDRELPDGRERETPNSDVPGGADEPTDPKAERSGIGRQHWEQLPSDPDLVEDFGYAFGEWEEFATPDSSETVMFLPADEEVLQQDAFVVVAEDSMVDLGKQY